MTLLSRLGRLPVFVFSLAHLASSASAQRHSYEPVSDLDDGELVNGTTWDSHPLEATVEELLLTLGRTGTSTYDILLAYEIPDLSGGSVVHDARLRLNEQGGEITAGLTVRITAALDLDPLSVSAASRFQLPRTSPVMWTIPASWDSSGQRVAKWEETPDLSPVLNELLGQPGWDASAKAAVFFLEVSGPGRDGLVRFDDTHGPHGDDGFGGVRPVRLIVSERFRDAFYGKELLCRPRPTSIEVNVIPHADTEAFIEFGPDSLSLTSSTPETFISANTAHEFLLSCLTPDTRYFYRLRSRPSGSSEFQAGDIRTFVTLPTAGTEARVCVTTDIHVTNTVARDLRTAVDLLETTLTCMENYLSPARYHVWIDTGDLVVIRALRAAFDHEEVEQRYQQAREWIDRVGHSLPFILVRGNHEEVNGWDYDSTPENTAIWSGRSLLKYFPPPLPDPFYSGNRTPFPHLGLPGNFFAFSAGGIRFRCLDPFLFSLTRPHNAHEQTDGSGDCWDWTLGTSQYRWLHDDLRENRAPYDVVALHHLTSCYAIPSRHYGRGGTEVSKFSVSGRPSFEWGGEDSLGVNVVTTKRPSFVQGSVHDMLVAGRNQVILKGHDHFYGRQELDGMVYLTMAKPDETEERFGHLWGWRPSAFYPEDETVFRENSGFLSIVADDDSATFEYIQTYPSTGLGSVRDRFSIRPGLPSIETPPSLQTLIHSVAPNPAWSPPRIEFELGREGPVTVSIHDVSGRLVRELVDDVRCAGPYEIQWDGRDGDGRRAAAGAYFATVRAGNRVDSAKIIVVR